MLSHDNVLSVRAYTRLFHLYMYKFYYIFIWHFIHMFILFLSVYTFTFLLRTSYFQYILICKDQQKLSSHASIRFVKLRVNKRRFVNPLEFFFFFILALSRSFKRQRWKPTVLFVLSLWFSLCLYPLLSCVLSDVF